MGKKKQEKKKTREPRKPDVKRPRKKRVQKEEERKQRLLYLHAATPNVFSTILGYTFIEPRPDARPEITATEQDWPYENVHEAIVDGWQVVQFPHLQAPFDDADLDVVGYEFILQKMEIVGR
ncbi:MAG: hypothetical protein VX733_03855 [Candidatus Latescibacterota bacterium]|nr:hypothetical protein [Candidatus Latescibacterota bacterium]